MMRGISKTFPGVRALSDVALDAHAGEVLALMGENGAGKSTLMKILSGAYRPDPGADIRVDGRKVTIHGPRDARAAGIAIIYQELALAPNLSVAENIHLGAEPMLVGGRLDRTRLRESCRPVLERLGAPFGPDTIVGTLSIAEQQLVEIARALFREARILVLDEPTTALSSRETDRLFALVRQLRAEGIALIYISHRMAEIYELADRVSVLRDGHSIGTLERDQISSDALVRMMVGRDLSSFYMKSHDEAAARGEPVLVVEGLTDGGRRVHPCSFTLHQGEVLGLAGLVGAGRTELARLIFGADTAHGGTMTLDGKPFAPHGPADAIAQGVVYLTEDRKALGLFLDMSCETNIVLDVIERDAGFAGRLNLKRAHERARAAFGAMRVRAASTTTSVGSLSGGNQQKILLSRLLESGPRVLILDEPTRGVDVGAKSEIYRVIDALSKKGMAILVISSELPEILGVSDRVIVMREGHIAGEVGGPGQPHPTQHAIMVLAASENAA